MNLKPGERNIALLLSYDGTLFSGWQYQKNARTVQGEAEKALQKLMKHPIKLYGASRTDAGVHAAGHVSNFKCACSIPVSKIPIALSTVLPDDIVCLKAAEVDDSFNARFSAIGKQYSYYIDNRPATDIFSKRYAYHEPGKLDIKAMLEVMKLLAGEHDFRAFQAQGSPSLSGTVRRLYALSLWKENNNKYSLLGSEEDYEHDGGRWNAGNRYTACSHFSENEDCGCGFRLIVHGSGFLYNMMRIIAGTVVYAGLSKIGTAEVAKALHSGDRTLCGKTLPPKGLCLDRVDYNFPVFNREEI